MTFQRKKQILQSSREKMQDVRRSEQKTRRQSYADPRLCPSSGGADSSHCGDTGVCANP